MKKEDFCLFTLSLLFAACGKGEKEFDATGTFEATEVTVSAMSAGELKTFGIEERNMVEADSVVGQIDDATLRLKKRELESVSEQLSAQARSLSASKDATDSRQLDLNLQLASQEQQLANLRRERTRYQELVNDGAAPRKQLDEINYQIRVQEKQISAVREQISSNNASLSKQVASVGEQIHGIEAQIKGIGTQQLQLDEQIEKAIVKSPVKGTVLEKYVENGEFVSVGKPLFKVADTEHMFMKAYITSAQLQKVKIGQKVRVYADYGNGERREYDGTVSWISSKSEFTPKTILTDDERADLVYAVKIAVKNDGYIKIGMYGEVKIN